MIARVAMLGSLAVALAAPLAAQNVDVMFQVKEKRSGTIEFTPVTPQAPAGPAVGSMAPDFTAPGAAKDGIFKSPVHLSDFKGKTVVLAFFPKARTSGCTMQMTHYRDLYDSLFVGGKGVVLLGISVDPDTTLANWAKEQNFPFRFVSDSAGAIGKMYGTLGGAATMERRDVYVVAPDGKVSYVKVRFSPNTPPQYDTLGVEIKKTLKK